MMATGRHRAVVVHDPELIPAGILARLVRRRPVVFDLHENLPGQLATKEWVWPPLRAPLGWLARLLLRLAERLLVVTLAEDGYRPLFRRDHPVFPNYLDPDRLPPVGTTGDGIVYVGDVTAERGVPLAVEAAGTSGVDAAMTIVGRCSPELEARLQALAARYGLVLEVTGRLPHARAMVLASGAGLGLAPLLDTPNYRGSLPTKVLEYLAVGIPVVASDLPETRRVVGERPGVELVAPGEVETWAEAIRQMYRDRSWQERARAGAEAVRRDFRWPIEDVLSFYQALIDRADRG